MWDTNELEKDVERCPFCNSITSADVCPNGCEGCQECGEELEDGVCPSCSERCSKCGYIIVDGECGCPPTEPKSCKGKVMVFFVCPECGCPETVTYHSSRVRYISCPDCYKEVTVKF